MRLNGFSVFNGDAQRAWAFQADARGFWGWFWPVGLDPFLCWPDLLAVICSMNGLNHEVKTLGNMEVRWSPGRNISMLRSFERYCCTQASEPAEECPSLQVLARARPCWLRWCLFSNLVAFASARGQALSGSKACATMQCSKRILPGNRSRPYVPCPSSDDGPSCVDHFSPLDFWLEVNLFAAGTWNQRELLEKWVKP